MTLATSQEAQNAYNLVTSLQKRFVEKLNHISNTSGQQKEFEEVTWLRDEGKHGGGSRFEARDKELFNTGSVNVSQVHYEDMPEKNLLSATAISTIIHPKNPLVPSIHIHISYTQLKEGDSYWRIMADLNPSIENSSDKEVFEKALKDLSDNYYEEGSKQGDKYFFIPALNRTRGISHFYLENHFTNDKEADYKLAQTFGEGIIDTYIDIVTNALESRSSFDPDHFAEQLNYHTLYLFQVLTLDRGTTSGLLIHDQNDVGIMGSLPSFVNKELLESFISRVASPQDELVQAIVDSINGYGQINIKTKKKLAQVVREHYKKYPESLKMQASGNTIPNTVGNHKE